MTPDISLLSHCVTLVSPITIATANGSSMSVVSISSISSRVPSIFDVFYDQVTRKQIGTGRRVGDLYVLENLHIPPSSSLAPCPAKDRTKLSARCVLCVFLRYGIHQKATPVAKEDLIYLDPFPSDVSKEEYSSTLDITDIPLPATSPEVSDCPSPPTTSSLPSLNPDPPGSRYPTRFRHPPVKFHFTNICFSSSYRSFLSRPTKKLVTILTGWMP
ncbi:hypothetical protein Acr_27g0003140 [Actinidia rufa]|uniref:Uncharacterized protein n=1 Tax=Actinidia rufa TaxID=165716 RepID=A0A7J0H6J9_9ERIC|nr:hypothetical protein Acr_27g0003140 [Actinidia rufa]